MSKCFINDGHYMKLNETLGNSHWTSDCWSSESWRWSDATMSSSCLTRTSTHSGELRLRRSLLEARVVFIDRMLHESPPEAHGEETTKKRELPLMDVSAVRTWMVMWIWWTSRFRWTSRSRSKNNNAKTSWLPLLCMYFSLSLLKRFSASHTKLYVLLWLQKGTIRRIDSLISCR